MEQDSKMLNLVGKKEGERFNRNLLAALTMRCWEITPSNQAELQPSTPG